MMSTSNNTIRSIFFVFLLIYIGYHTWSLPLYPFPWFDEVYFASITENFLAEGTFIPEIASVAKYQKEALTYGPVYFLLTALSFKTVGFGIISFRLVAWLAGWGAVLLTWRIAKSNPLTKFESMLFLFIFCLDPFFLYNMHRGRMETVALVWMLLALLLSLRTIEQKQPGNYMYFLSGCFTVLALLTTPRTGILLAGMTPVLINMFYRPPSKIRWKKLILWIAPVIAAYGTWIIVGFGNISAFIMYYLKIAGGNETAHSGYLGGNLYIPKHEYVLIATSILAVIVLVLQYPNRLIKPRILSCLLTFLLYYAFVKDWGPYSVLIIPFYYILIAEAFHCIVRDKAKRLWRNPVTYSIILLAGFNLAYQAGKGIQVISSSKERDPSRLYRFMDNQLPEGARVTGPPSLYYAVRKANCSYQLYNKYNTLEKREWLHRKRYDYDYLITTQASQNRDQHVLKHYKDQANLVKIAELAPVSNNSHPLSKRIPLHQESGYYQAIIYKRKKAIQAGN